MPTHPLKIGDESQLSLLGSATMVGSAQRSNDDNDGDHNENLQLINKHFEEHNLYINSLMPIMIIYFVLFLKARTNGIIETVHDIVFNARNGSTTMGIIVHSDRVEQCFSSLFEFLLHCGGPLKLLVNHSTLPKCSVPLWLQIVCWTYLCHVESSLLLCQMVYANRETLILSYGHFARMLAASIIQILMKGNTMDFYLWPCTFGPNSLRNSDISNTARPVLFHTCNRMLQGCSRHQHAWSQTSDVFNNEMYIREGETSEFG